MRRRRTILRLRDLLDEALAGVAARPTRLVLTTIGTMLGIAALVGTLGLGQTAAGQITERFDLAAATRVVVAAGQQQGPDGENQALTSLPWDAPERIRRLNGVRHAGTYSRVGDKDRQVRTVPVLDGGAAKADYLPVGAASPGLFAAVGAKLTTGRWFDAGHDRRGDPVVVLGRVAAERLGINRVNSQPTIFVDGRPYTVIGIIDTVSNRTELLDAAILPNGTAQRDFRLPAPEELDIRTRIGATQLVARQARLAIDPNRPGALTVDAPPAQNSVRRDVEADVDALFLLLGGVALLVGGLGIANVTLLSVLERTPEIGLRRALGAARRHIAGQFLVESVLIGFLGGLLGTAVGVLSTVAVSAARGWTPLLDTRLAIAAPLLGAVIGLVAGTYPAWRAASIEPIAALRGA
ncbi:MAG TPA: ABC transporter permease [Actinopolymorphaceae bacterium]